jgi:hypothetical protein
MRHAADSRQRLHQVLKNIPEEKSPV